MSQDDDTVALLEASVSAFLRRQTDPFGQDATWTACCEMGLFSLLGSAPDSLDIFLNTYARLLTSISRCNGQLAFAVAQTNQARLLEAETERTNKDVFDAAVLVRPNHGPGSGPCVQRYESAMAPEALNTLWVGCTPNEDIGTLRAISSDGVDVLSVMPLAQGAARYVFTLQPEVIGKSESVYLSEPARQTLMGKQVLDAMAIANGQLWHGYELALAFCDERQIFNRRLVQFQNVQAVLADIYARLRVLCAVISAACIHIKADAADRLEVLYAIHRRTSLRVASDLMQAFGGTAFMADSGMPEIYSNVTRLSLGSLWLIPPRRCVGRSEWLACKAADWIGEGVAGTDVLFAIDKTPDAVERWLELAGLCLTLKHLGTGDDGCDGSLHTYLAHKVRECCTLTHGIA